MIGFIWARLDKGYAINTYFLDHPEMILGTLEEQSTNLERNIP